MKRKLEGKRQITYNQSKTSEAQHEYELVIHAPMLSSTYPSHLLHRRTMFEAEAEAQSLELHRPAVRGQKTTNEAGLFD